MLIYLDESGDLGWTFTQPYRCGGSSRHLTIASLAVSSSKRHLPKRLIKKLYNKFNWPVSKEKKWSDMSSIERVWFAQKAKELMLSHPSDVSYHSITVKKENVQPHIREDPNKLYNYMICLSLLDEMARHNSVRMIPDPRSIKVESGNSLHDYLQTKLWFDAQVKTTLTTIPCDSASSRNVQFSDMLSGIVQGHFEDKKSKPWDEIGALIKTKTLFF